jgi:hypothetical protein
MSKSIILVNMIPVKTESRQNGILDSGDRQGCELPNNIHNLHECHNEGSKRKLYIYIPIDRDIQLPYY